MEGSAQQTTDTSTLQPDAIPQQLVESLEGESGLRVHCTSLHAPKQTFSDLAPSGLEGLALCLNFPRLQGLSQVTGAFLIGFPRKSVASPSPGDSDMDLGPFSSGTSQAPTTPTFPLFGYKTVSFLFSFLKKLHPEIAKVWEI